VTVFWTFLSLKEKELSGTEIGFLRVMFLSVLGCPIVGLLALISLMRVLWSDAFGSRLVIDQKNFSLQRWWLGLWRQKTGQWARNINRVKLSFIRLPLLPKPITVITLKSSKWWRKYRFGLFLTQQEKEWLVEQIRAFLEKKP
jgi:hypothetical protein